MEKMFLSILNMSLTGAFVIIAICLARLPLRKAPKSISYALWMVAGFRLAFPFSFESVFSLIPFKAQTIPADIAAQSTPRIDSGIPFLNSAVSSILPAATPQYSANPLQIWIAVGAYVWLVGVVVMVIYGVVSFVVLKRKMRDSTYSEANIYEAKNIKSPFVLGVFSPKIYLPVDLPYHEREYLLLHEQTHIRRRDYIVKLMAYCMLCLHWFNPLVWLAFVLMSADMEMSCDERVIREFNGSIRSDYSMSLVRIATGKRILGSSPLAFGEGGAKERVKRVLNFKKPPQMVVVAAVVLVAVLSIGCAANRPITLPDEPPAITVMAGGTEIAWVVGQNHWNGSVFDRSDNFQSLMTGKTIDDLVFIQNGEQIEITFEGLAPSQTMLTECTLNENGTVMYVVEKAYATFYSVVNDGQISLRSFVFTVEPNNVVRAISSSSFDDYIKGYRFVVNWSGNEWEYVFIIRGN